MEENFSDKMITMIVIMSWRIDTMITTMPGYTAVSLEYINLMLTIVYMTVNLEYIYRITSNI